MRMPGRNGDRGLIDMALGVVSLSVSTTFLLPPDGLVMI